MSERRASSGREKSPIGKRFAIGGRGQRAELADHYWGGRRTPAWTTWFRSQYPEMYLAALQDPRISGGRHRPDRPAHGIYHAGGAGRRKSRLSGSVRGAREQCGNLTAICRYRKCSRWTRRWQMPLRSRGFEMLLLGLFGAVALVLAGSRDLWCDELLGVAAHAGDWNPNVAGSQPLGRVADGFSAGDDTDLGGNGCGRRRRRAVVEGDGARWYTVLADGSTDVRGGDDPAGVRRFAGYRNSGATCCPD